MVDNRTDDAINAPVPLARPWFDTTEPEAAHKVVETGWLIGGAAVEQFEERFAAAHGARHGIAVNSGSSALLVAMAALGVEPGDEVVTPDMTFVSTASAALFLGATPRFADIEPVHHNLDPADLERRITPQTRLVVPVHYAGRVCDMDAILEVTEPRGIAVLEDAAEAHGARLGGRHAGTFGAAGIFSFTPTKLMTTGEGGMIVTDDDEVARRCRLFRNFGDSGKFDWQGLGFNFRMPEVMGAIGAQQLDKLPEAMVARRRVAARYTAALRDEPAITTPATPPPGQEESINWQLYTILLDLDRLTVDRDEVIERLAGRGIASRLYYPPLHRAGVFAGAGPFDDAWFPVTLDFAARALSLPIFPGLGEDQQDRVVDELLGIVSDARR